MRSEPPGHLPRREFDAFVDQMALGAYGYNAIEAMAQGVPTLCHLKEDIPPVINCRGDGSDLVELLMELRDGKYREFVGRQSRDFVTRTHGYKAVGRMWGRIYAEVME